MLARFVRWRVSSSDRPDSRLLSAGSFRGWQRRRLGRDCRSVGASPDPGPDPQVNRNGHERGPGRDPREDLEHVGADAGASEEEDVAIPVEARGADPEMVQEAPEA